MNLERQAAINNGKQFVTKLHLNVLMDSHLDGPSLNLIFASSKKVHETEGRVTIQHDLVESTGTGNVVTSCSTEMFFLKNTKFVPPMLGNHGNQWSLRNPSEQSTLTHHTTQALVDGYSSN